MAHLKASATSSDPEARYHWKWQLMRGLYQSKYTRDDVVKLLRFIDWVMKLPAELASKLNEDIATYEAEVNMPYITSFERIGMEKGIEKGRLEGLRAGEASILRRQLCRRFESLPSWVEERLEAAEQEELERWAERVLEAESLEAVFAA